ncbi:MAG: hypothetical protein FWD57_11650 [Polyangiaceae bacterium]|nr:hypothetical protein [Polyangiaceae bacterium]
MNPGSRCCVDGVAFCGVGRGVGGRGGGALTGGCVGAGSESQLGCGMNLAERDLL